MSKLKIVQFADGKYAIRKKSFFFTSYLSLYNYHKKLFYDENEYGFEVRCITESLEEITKIYCFITVDPKVIDVKCNCKKH